MQAATPPTHFHVTSQITISGRSLQDNSARSDIRGLFGTIPPYGRDAPQGAYVHIPFCFHKCHYCDFYSVVDGQDRQEAFTEALAAEFAAAQPYLSGPYSRPLETLFFGGGTPTLLRPALWASLLEALHEHVPLADGAEFTVEANPETVTPELVGLLVAGGVNRVSIGAQTFDPRLLRVLERWHDPGNVNRSVGMLRDGGIGRINLDLIFGIPGQTLNEWAADLDRALTLEPEHLSCYALTYEPNTALTKRRDRGLVTPVDNDLEAAMYELTLDRLAEAGYEHYEISAWAKPGKRSRHNLLYWTNRAWWPFGPGATGQAWGVRWRNVPRLSDYLARAPWPTIMDVERPDQEMRMAETLMLGFRLLEGMEHAAVLELIEESDDAARRLSVLREHCDRELLEVTGSRIRLSRRGLLLADAVIAELL